MKKTLMFVVEEGFTARSLLRSDFFSLTKNYFERVIIITPKQKINYYREKYGDDNVIFEEMVENEKGVIKKIVFKILKFSIPADLNRVKLMRTVFAESGRLKLSPWLVYFPFLYLFWFMGRYELYRRFVRWLYYLLPSDGNCIYLINKYQPNLVYANYSDIGINNFNLDLLKEAKKKNIKTVGNIFSWDNLYSKVFVPFHTDYLTVPTVSVQKEVLRISDFPVDRVKVVGFPHFDFYFKNNLIANKDEFLVSIGADPKNNLIVFTLGNKPTEINLRNFLRIIEKEIVSLGGVQVYISPYPKRKIDEDVIDEFSKNPNFIFGKDNKIEGSGSLFEFKEDSHEFTANLFSHASLIVGCYSTMPIDAAILDTPFILINYPNDKKNRNKWHSIEIHSVFEHIKYLLSFNSLRIVNSNEELIQNIKMYLKHPDVDSAERKKLSLEVAPDRNGKAARQLFDVILNHIQPKKKKILIVINNGFVARSLLRTSFFERIKDFFESIILLVPKEKLDYYKKNYASDQVLVEPIFKIRHNNFVNRFSKILKYSIPTKTVKIKIAKLLYSSKGQINSVKHVFYFAVLMFFHYLSRFTICRKALRLAYSCIPVDYSVGAFLDKHRPDLIYARYTSPFVNDFNLELLKAGKQRKITTVGNIFSWDNIYSKIFITSHSDYLVVPNDFTKRDSVILGDFDPDRVKVVGFPHFDFYFDSNLAIDKKDFLLSIGADPNKKIIFFAGGLQSLRIDYLYFFNFFDRLTKSRSDLQVYLSPHPKALFDSELIRKYENNKNLIFKIKESQYSGRSFEFPKGDNVWIYNMLRCSDMVVCLYSTLMIEAAIFNRPIININYFGNKEDNYFHSIKRFPEMEHVSQVLETNSVDVVNNDEEFIDSIKRYLDNPQFKSAERAEMLDRQTSGIKGNSADKLAEVVINVMKKHE